MNSADTLIVMLSCLLRLNGNLRLHGANYVSTISAMISRLKAYKFRFYPDADQRQQLAAEADRIGDELGLYDAARPQD